MRKSLNYLIFSINELNFAVDCSGTEVVVVKLHDKLCLFTIILMFIHNKALKRIK